MATSLGGYIQILIGPRQCGKSSLLSKVGNEKFRSIDFDDLQLRKMAELDPALFLSQNEPPLNLDEVQYVPNLFPQLKLEVDRLKKKKLQDNNTESITTIYRLSGSNQILLSSHVRESLVGRAQYFYLNTLSVSEINRSFPELKTSEIIFKGGLPELYTNPDLKVVAFINDYITQYVQKDVAYSAGVQKIKEFNLVLGLVAARVGQLINYTDIAKDSGVKSVTIKEWISVLESSHLLYTLKPFASNLNKRLVKTPKTYFWDTGLAVRLQGWSELQPLQQSPQIGLLFENLVLAEIIKFMQNFGKSWNIFFWRNKEEEEVDFIIEINPQKYIALEAKWGLNSTGVKLSQSFKSDFPSVHEIILVVPEGDDKNLTPQCRQISIKNLATFLTAI